MEDFVSFNLALKLKEKGFKEECLAYYTSEYTIYNNEIALCDDKYLVIASINYNEFLVWHNSKRENKFNNICDAPTISQVLKWLREEKGFVVNVFLDDDSDTPVTYEIYDINNKIECVMYHHGEYFSIEDWDKASLTGIEYVLDNLI